MKRVDTPFNIKFQQLKQKIIESYKETTLIYYQVTVDLIGFLMCRLTHQLFSTS